MMGLNTLYKDIEQRGLMAGIVVIVHTIHRCVYNINSIVIELLHPFAV